MHKLLTYSQRASVRWMLTLLWTGITAWLMLSPGNDGGTAAETSAFFGGTDITDAGGHVVLMAILLVLWSWTLSLYAPGTKTARLILTGGIIWGLGVELLQSVVPERGTSLLDLTANLLGVLIGLTVFRWLTARRNHAISGHTA